MLKNLFSPLKFRQNPPDIVIMRIAKLVVIAALTFSAPATQASCIRATPSQVAQVNEGNAKIDKFLDKCAAATGNSPWCQQLTRPNPDSISQFYCTYGRRQPHTLIHPDESTWINAFRAAQIVEALGKKGIRACEIYNWWRPEPYNANVDGKPGRHPTGTSIDVKFCSERDVEEAFSQLCKWRAQGKIRALGYYGNTKLHLGVGDHLANTWGKSCP